MLHDPKKVLDKSLTLEGFLSYVETRNPRTPYHWSEQDKCACTQWLIAIGQISQDNWIDWPADMGNPEDAVMKANALAANSPHTFGSLAKRIRAHLDQQATRQRLRIPKAA
jgi:hypothetical protein